MAQVATIAPVVAENQAEKGVSVKEILDRLAGVFPMDEAVIEQLPPGYTFVSVEHFGFSAWTITGKLIARAKDETEKAFFLKVAYGAHGSIMMKGEYESSTAIYKTVPGIIPEPFGYGAYKVQNPTTFFYLSEYVDMDVYTAPDPIEFTTRVAELHSKSQSPKAKFGFNVTTCDGKMAHYVQWEDSWATFYAKLLQRVCKLDLESNGAWPEFEAATHQTITKVIPRLLGALQSEGRSIKPCLIHGDLYDMNMGIRMETGESILFDAGSYYAHNEMELGHWRTEFASHFRAEIYLRSYLQSYPAAEPVEEFDDRNRLYSIKGCVNYSAGHPGSTLRRTAYNHMAYLCEKYAPLERIVKYDPAIDPSITGATIVPHAEIT